jgi:E1A/CREB-binding protein
MSTNPEILRQQRIRLALLCHAFNCKAPNGKCPDSPYCTGMKRVLYHTIDCTRSTCPLNGCASSMCLWNHFLLCERQCPLCTDIEQLLPPTYPACPISPPSSNSSVKRLVPNDGVGSHKRIRDNIGELDRQYYAELLRVCGE